MVGRRTMIGFLVITSILGCSQVLVLDTYSPRPAASPDSGSDGGSIPYCRPESTGSCKCHEDNACFHDCSEANCTFICATGAQCTGGCAGGGCTFICAENSTCSESCEGGGCTFVCDPTATCSNTCAGGGCK